MRGEIYCKIKPLQNDIHIESLAKLSIAPIGLADPSSNHTSSLGFADFQLKSDQIKMRIPKPTQDGWHSIAWRLNMQDIQQVQREEAIVSCFSLSPTALFSLLHVRVSTTALPTIRLEATLLAS